MPIFSFKKQQADHILLLRLHHKCKFKKYALVDTFI